MRIIILIVAIFLLYSCQSEASTSKTIDLINRDGDVIGEATFAEQAEGVEVEVSVVGLSPGFHGIHLHEFPKCDTPSFESAGSHWTVDDAKHGLMHPEGHHIGDMPNLEVKQDGTAMFTYVISEATLREGKGSIYSDEGKSLIIHEDMDDGVSQPAGNAGERIACGAITKSSEQFEEENPGEDVKEEEEEA
ncbi:superoxide dismutase family protein [Halalkalibacillus halophilus]|uniref:superoxide dismutase family protein n=1 Tax=Halalkalibacillus halophilus TaxID=392827 RepID=UPI00041E6CF1|nr:superoxide dismutase family protein [Halalkalibacillus halophilus]